MWTDGATNNPMNIMYAPTFYPCNWDDTTKCVKDDVYVDMPSCLPCMDGPSRGTSLKYHMVLRVGICLAIVSDSYKCTAATFLAFDHHYQFNTVL